MKNYLYTLSNIDFVARCNEIGYFTIAGAPNTTSSATSMNIVSHKCWKVVIDYVRHLKERKKVVEFLVSKKG